MAVDHPIHEVAPLAAMRGFVDDYYHHTEDVLLLTGEIHGGRKPVSLSMRWASAAADRGL